MLHVLILLPASYEQEIRSDSNSCAQTNLKMSLWRSRHQTPTFETSKWGSVPLTRWWHKKAGFHEHLGTPRQTMPACSYKDLKWCPWIAAPEAELSMEEHLSNLIFSNNREAQQKQLWYDTTLFLIILQTGKQTKRIWRKLSSTIPDKKEQKSSFRNSNVVIYSTSTQKLNNPDYECLGWRSPVPRVRCTFASTSGTL